MGVVLYRIGTSKVVDGWECDCQVFDPDYLNFEARFSEGWHLTPDCGRTKDEPKIVEIIGDGMQIQAKEPKEKAAKPKKARPKKEIDEKKPIWKKYKDSFELDLPMTEEKILNGNSITLRLYAKEYKVKNYSRSSTSKLRKDLLEKLGEENVQNRPDQQCVQPAPDIRDTDNESVSG